MQGVATEYSPTEWRDHIIDPTRYEKDENGNTVIDAVTDKPKLKVIQEGTRFTAARANNIELGIFSLYLWVEYYKKEMEKMRIMLEIGGRAPINSGTFFDPFDDAESAKALTLLTNSVILQNRTDAGATTLEINSAPFAVGEYVTIYDDEQSESVYISVVGSTSVTVTALINSYKKGAKAARSNSVLNGGELTYGAWGTCTVNVVEVV